MLLLVTKSLVHVTNKALSIFESTLSNEKYELISFVYYTPKIDYFNASTTAPQRADIKKAGMESPIFISQIYANLTHSKMLV